MDLGIAGSNPVIHPFAPLGFFPRFLLKPSFPIGFAINEGSETEPVASPIRDTEPHAATGALGK